MTKDLADWEDPLVQTIYKMLCDHDERPENPEEHWEGYIARRIVATLGQPQTPRETRVDGMVAAFTEVADYLQAQGAHAYANYIRRRGTSLTRPDGNSK
jgi:hypothetical protein